MGERAEYDASKIVVLEGLEPVRKRPRMYIGSTDAAGIENMVLELVSNALSEHLEGHAGRISVGVTPTGWCEVEDDGRGLSLEVHRGVPIAEHALTRIVWDGRSRQPGRADWAKCLHGVGLAVVNGLSSRMEVTIRRGELLSTMAFERGIASEPLVTRPGDGSTGTHIRFMPDAEIFGAARGDVARLRECLADIAHLAPTATWSLQGEVLDGDGGPAGWLSRLTAAPLLEDARVSVRHVVGNVLVDAALDWSTGSGPPELLTFANFARTRGQSQLDGVLNALRSLVPDRDPAELARGLVGVVHVGLSQPQYGGATKEVLLDPIAEAAIADALVNAFAPRREWWERFLEGRR